MSELGKEQHSGHHVSMLTYVVVWAAVVALVLGNFGLAFTGIGWFLLVIQLAIASTEALLILVYFMHLREQKGARRWVLPLAFIFLALLGTITMFDVATRWGPTRPSFSSQTAFPEYRPAPTRTEQKHGGPGPGPSRLPGQ